MKRLFDKDEIWFAVGWIILYVVCFSSADQLSERIGVPKLLTVLIGLFMATVLCAFIKKNHLSTYFGLCGVKKRGGDVLFFVPLIVLSTVNFWNGITLSRSALETVLFVLSMCFVGFLEEVIFRGLLFKAMCKTGVKTAVIVSSLTFGMGHIINLLLGAPVLDTLLQLLYASAIGFCYTAIFMVSGSILPCVLSHIAVNATSVLAPELGTQRLVVIALVQTVLGVGYGWWLLRRHKKTGISEERRG
jgi:membrane protease YdiL (CAAX protease family)